MYARESRTGQRGCTRGWRIARLCRRVARECICIHSVGIRTMRMCAPRIPSCPHGTDPTGADLGWPVLMLVFDARYGKWQVFGRVAFLCAVGFVRIEGGRAWLP